MRAEHKSGTGKCVNNLKSCSSERAPLATCQASRNKQKFGWNLVWVSLEAQVSGVALSQLLGREADRKLDYEGSLLCVRH